jgi:WD40 repeat protein
LSYREEDQQLFRGRETEKNKLFKLVEYNFLTVVFGKSGIGKTSLLNAGLFPKLRDNDFLPITLRLDYSPSAPGLMEQVRKKIREALKKNNIQEKERTGEAKELGGEETLWEYFHRVKHVDSTGSKMITPVLVFDQFEEIFTIGKSSPGVPGLLEELYYLCENQIPDPVKTRIKKEKKTFPYMKDETKVRIIVSLREDYLPHLNSFKTLFPSIDRVMFRVLHLHGKQAGEVITVPGGIQDENVINNILDLFQPGDDKKVPLEKLEIEPSLLSLLCFQLFEKQDMGLLTKSYQDKILADFYNSVLKKFPAKVNRFVESKLLTEGGSRTPFYLEKDHKLRISIDNLINERILRKVYYGEKEHIEIIHDVLAPIIKEKRNRRVKKTKNVIIGVLLGLLIIMSTLTWYAFHQENKARKQLVNSLTSKAHLILETDHVKAIRIAEAAHNIKAFPKMPRPLMQVLIDTAASTYERPFYNAKMQHADDVNYAEFSPDETKILTASDDGTAKLWDLNGKPLISFNQHTDAVNSAVFSPDGKRILTASEDGTAKLWDLEGNLTADLNKHKGAVLSAVFSGDGTRILTCSEDQTAKLWDSNGEFVASLNKHTDFVNSALFSPDGTRILTASDDGTAKLWDSQGIFLFEYKHTSAVHSAKFSLDGEKIVTASSDKTAKVWDLRGELLADLKGEHKHDVLFAEFSPDGTKIVTASVDQTAKVWDWKERDIDANLKEHANSIRRAVFSSDDTDTRVLTCSNDATARVWDLEGNVLAKLDVHTGAVLKAVFSSDGTRILTASEDRTAKLWDLKGKLVKDLVKHKGAIKSAKFSPDGEKIVTASLDKTARVSDLNGQPLAELIKHKGAVNYAEFSPDGKRIVTASMDTTAKLWDLQGRVLVDLRNHKRGVLSAKFSRDGKEIVTASRDQTAKVWDLNGQLLRDLNEHKGTVNYAEFSPDGKKIVTASSDKTAKLWDREGKLLETFDKHTDKVNYAEFSPDGTCILTASDDKTAKLWDLQGNCLKGFNLDTDAEPRAVFSPDGKRILTAAGRGNPVKLWDLNGELLADFNKYIGTVSCAVFSPHGKRILIANEKGTAKLWYTPEGIIQWLKTANIPRLTEKEKKEFGIE